MIKYWTVSAFSVLLGAASLATAASVTTDDVLALTKCATYDSIAVDANGNVKITNCNNGSTGTKFVVNAAVTATTGLPLDISVTRTGGVAGEDNLTLTSTLNGASFNPTVLKFSAAANTAALTSTVTFTTKGAATLSVTGGGTTNTVTSKSIEVLDPVPGSCAGITAPAYISPLPGVLNPLEGIGGGTHRIPVSDAESYATGAFSFTVPATPPVQREYTFNFADSSGGNLGKDINVSQCAGDFNANCLISLAYGSDSYHFLPVVATAASTCSVVLGKTYYLNIRSKFKGAPMSFVLNVLPQ